MKHGKSFNWRVDYQRGYKTMMNAPFEFMQAFDDFEYDWRDWFDSKPSLAFNRGMEQAAIHRGLSTYKIEG